MEMDWTVGEVVAALKRAGVAENTLVIFTSDNGPEIWNYEEARDYKHYAMGPLRGVKQDTWEGGHRVPFIACWPDRIPAGATNAEVICHSDLMATAAAIVGVTLPANAGEDSYNILPALLGKNSTSRSAKPPFIIAATVVLPSGRATGCSSTRRPAAPARNPSGLT